MKNPLIIRYQFHTSTFALPRADAMTIYPGQILAFDLPDYFRSANREHPIQFRFGVHNELKLTVNLPENRTVIMPATLDSIDSPFGSVSWNYASKENKVFVHLNCHLNGKKIDSELYPEFQNFLDEIKARDLREVIIARNTE